MINDYGEAFLQHLVQIEMFPTSKSRKITTFATNPSDIHTLLIATEDGSIYPRSSFGEKREKLHHYSLFAYDVDCTKEGFKTIPNSLSYSPHHSNYFICGYSSGHIALFKTDCSVPIISWVASTEQSVIHVEWSKQRTSVFYALLNNSCLLIWDIFQSTVQPISVMNEWKTGNINKFSLSTLQGIMVSSGAQNINIHILSPDLCNVRTGESEMVEKLKE